MTAIIFVFPEPLEVEGQECQIISMIYHLPVCPVPGARIMIENIDYTCGQAYWFQPTKPHDIYPPKLRGEEWVARIKLYPTTPRTKDATLTVERHQRAEPPVSAPDATP